MNFQHLSESPMEYLNIPYKAIQSPQWSNSKSLTEHLYVPKEFSMSPGEHFKVPNGAFQSP